MSPRLQPLPLALCFAALWSPPSHALNIVINPGAALAGNPAALAAFNRAADLWESRLTDNVVVTISANLASLSPGIIGSAGSVELYGDTFAEIRNSLVADGAHAVLFGDWDDAIVTHLPTFAQWSAHLPAGRTLADRMYATKANLKAILLDDGGLSGLTPADLDTLFGSTDAAITFSTNFSFDYDNSNGVSAGTMDFETVAAHEIGHALGFISAVDDIDQTTPAQYSLIIPTPLDLYRFRNPGELPNSLTSFETATRSLVPGANEALSDTLKTWQFSTGVLNGDGNQASHWKDDIFPLTNIGLMDPNLSFGQVKLPTEADFRAMDLIGWNVLPIPESASLLPSVALLCLLGISRRTRSARN